MDNAPRRRPRRGLRPRRGRDHDSSGVCYASVGSHDGSALVRLERVDGEWRRTEMANGGTQNVRPVVPWNRREDLRVCWLRGRYGHYAPRSSGEDAAFETAIVGDGVE